MITGQEIRTARKRAGLSQAQLAEKVGVVTRTVGSWERGENTPGLAEPRLLTVLRDHLGGAAAEPLQATSDVELLAEIARRFARSDKAGRGETGGDTAPMNEDGPLTPAHVGVIVSGMLPVGWTCHTLRHRCGTRAYAGTRDLRAVQELLGHAKPETTAIYTQVPSGWVREAMQAAAS